jgi:hypothetical protein
MAFDESQLHELVALLDRHGVRFQDAWVDHEEERGGVFIHNAVGGAMVRIFRPRSELVDGDWQPTIQQRREALFTLAHECGHVLSWSADKARWERVHAATMRFDHLKRVGASMVAGLSEDERRLILGEEEQAWKNGREYVSDELHAAYDDRAREMLRGYRSVLLPEPAARFSP